MRRRRRGRTFWMTELAVAVFLSHHSIYPDSLRERGVLQTMKALVNCSSNRASAFVGYSKRGVHASQIDHSIYHLMDATWPSERSSKHLHRTGQTTRTQ